MTSEIQATVEATLSPQPPSVEPKNQIEHESMMEPIQLTSTPLLAEIEAPMIPSPPTPSRMIGTHYTNIASLSGGCLV